MKMPRFGDVEPSDILNDPPESIDGDYLSFQAKLKELKDNVQEEESEKGTIFWVSSKLKSLEEEFEVRDYFCKIGTFFLSTFGYEDKEVSDYTKERIELIQTLQNIYFRIKEIYQERIKILGDLENLLSRKEGNILLDVAEERSGVAILEIISEYIEHLQEFTLDKRPIDIDKFVGEISRFFYQYEKFIDDLRRLPEGEKKKVLEFIRHSELWYPNADYVLKELYGVDSEKELDFENLLLIHKTDYLPHGQIETMAGVHTKMLRDPDNSDIAHSFYSSRGTISFSINFPVGDHMEGKFSDRDYAIMLPLQSVSDRVINMKEEDAFVFGDLSLENTGSVLIISSKKIRYLTPERLRILKANTGVEKIYLGEEGESINDSCVRVMREMGYSYLPGFKDGWYSVNHKEHLELEALAKRNKKEGSLHAMTVFYKLEEFINNVYARVLFNIGNIIPPDVDVKKYLEEEYPREVEKLIAEMILFIKKTGRDLTPEEEETIKKIRETSINNQKRLLEIAS